MDLRTGWPNETLLPIIDINMELNNGCLKNDLNYGKIEGEIYFRNILSTFLNNNTKSNIVGEDLFLINGISHGILLTIMIMLNIYKKKIIVLIENPTYFLAINMFTFHNLTIIPVKNNKNLEKNINDSNAIYLYYIIPFYQNPTGTNISYNNIENIINIMNKYNNLYVISDEAYQLFRNININKSLADYHDNIISLGSFSKILCPGIRLGWIYTKNIRLKMNYNNISYLKSGGGVSPIIQRVVCNLINSSKLNNIIINIMDYIDESIEIIDKHLYPIKLKKFIYYEKPQGGYFFWIKIKNIDAFLFNCESHNINLLKGNDCSYDSSFKNYIRICSCYLSHIKLNETLQLITKILEDIH